MNTVDPESFLADQIDRKFWPVFPTSLRSAYSAVGLMVEEQPILQVASAEQNRGRLVSWATDFALVRAINTGALPFDFDWRPWDKPTGRYLAIRLTHSVLSISQVSDPNHQPRSVRFRENGRLNNSLLFPFEELEEELRVKGLPHFLLIHGYQNLDFVHLAVPHPTHRTQFSYRTANLLDMPHAIPSDLPPVENTEADLEEVVILKEEIEKWIKDNGTDDE